MSLRTVEVDDEEAEKIIAETQYEELYSILKEISLNTSTDDNLTKAIIDQGQKIADIVKIIKAEPDNAELTLLFTTLSKDINKLINTLNTRLLPDTFTLVKSFGVTESVKINYKQANNLN